MTRADIYCPRCTLLKYTPIFPLGADGEKCQVEEEGRLEKILIATGGGRGASGTRVMAPCCVQEVSFIFYWGKGGGESEEQTLLSHYSFIISLCISPKHTHTTLGNVRAYLFAYIVKQPYMWAKPTVYSHYW